MIPKSTPRLWLLSWTQHFTISATYFHLDVPLLLHAQHTSLSPLPLPLFSRSNLSAHFPLSVCLQPRSQRHRIKTRVTWDLTFCFILHIQLFTQALFLLLEDNSCNCPFHLFSLPLIYITHFLTVLVYHLILPNYCSVWTHHTLSFSSLLSHNCSRNHPLSQDCFTCRLWKHLVLCHLWDFTYSSPSSGYTFVILQQLRKENKHYSHAELDLYPVPAL